jgi:hypothetical protein
MLARIEVYLVRAFGFPFGTRAGPETTFDVIVLRTSYYDLVISNYFL